MPQGSPNLCDCICMNFKIEQNSTIVLGVCVCYVLNRDCDIFLSRERKIYIVTLLTKEHFLIFSSGYCRNTLCLFHIPQLCLSRQNVLYALYARQIQKTLSLDIFPIFSFLVLILDDFTVWAI